MTLLCAPRLALDHTCKSVCVLPGASALSLFTSQQVRSMAVKTKSSVKKRFRVTGSGRIVRKKSGKRHLNIHKSSAQLSRLGKLIRSTLSCCIA